MMNGGRLPKCVHMFTLCVCVSVCVRACVCMCACMGDIIGRITSTQSLCRPLCNAFGGGLTCDFDDHFQQYFLYRRPSGYQKWMEACICKFDNCILICLLQLDNRSTNLSVHCEPRQQAQGMSSPGQMCSTMS